MSTKDDDPANTSADWESFLVGEGNSPNIDNKSNDISINNIISPKSMINNIKNKDSKKIFDRQFGNDEDEDVDVDLLNNANEGISSDYNTILEDDFQYLNDMSPIKTTSTSTNNENDNNSTLSIPENETLEQKIARVMTGISKSNKVSTSHTSTTTTTTSIINNTNIINTNNINKDKDVVVCNPIVITKPSVNPLMSQLGIDDAISPINSPFSDITSLNNSINNNDNSNMNLDKDIESDACSNVLSPVVSSSNSPSSNGSSNHDKSGSFNGNYNDSRHDSITNIPRISKERDPSHIRSVIIKMVQYLFYIIYLYYIIFYYILY
jgi:hypothetical protein